MNKQRLAAALELIGVLAERFPACFAVNPSYRRPLKLGIHVDILAQLSDTIAPRDLSDALRVYVGNPHYCKACTPGAARIDWSSRSKTKRRQTRRTSWSFIRQRWCRLRVGFLCPT